MDIVPDYKVVLVVDDEVFARLLAVQIFLDLGYTVLEAEDARQALDVLDRNDDVGLLLTDINMPGEMDGLGLIEQVRQHRPLIRCIATSGRVPAQPGGTSGCVTFLPKPYTAHHLAEAVRREQAAPLSRQSGEAVLRAA